MKSRFADNLWSSNNQEWNTPKWLYDKLNNYYNFETDPATTEDNPLGCNTFFTPETNGLDSNKWKGRVFINPPYDRRVQSLWVYEAQKYNQINDETVIMLLPARTDTLLWQNFIFPKADFICFIKGRLKFSGHKNAAPFPSAIVAFYTQPWELYTTCEEEELYNELGKMVRCNNCS